MQPTIPGEAEYKLNAIETVVKQVQEGDKQAYESIITSFERQMYAYCFYILKNHAETEDAVQEIFIRAYMNLHQYSRQVSFSAWLYKMAYHHLMNLKKKQGRWLKLVEHYKEQQSMQPLSHNESVIYELMAYQTTEERHILLLKAVEQYTFEEIGGIMCLNPATIRKKYERLRQKLMEHVSQERKRVHGTIAGTKGVR
ncbi:RNA polymerase sigma factor [Paenibacillus donghaensis]|uniref:RNA polymerase subunit sigma n=1 Tax=Paenibacillus donghaensis TaxID=414771 RepID=A0A2Z2KLT7_9BACL|nr:sigma-70 family RNA polymerase sigma factor [Paenibacillus donghaensis]ASA25305.1 RNA polymerase subunit sigma [Paenibacillus donghaensis]